MKHKTKVQYLHGTIFHIKIDLKTKIIKIDVIDLGDNMGLTRLNVEVKPEDGSYSYWYQQIEK